MTTTTDVQSRPGWTGRLWKEIEPIYGAILEHPFITGLASGELSVDRFVHFISQDTHYLHEYTRGLLALAAKAPTYKMTQLLTNHAAAAANAETGLHAELMTALGRDPAELETINARPTTHAYTSFIVSTVLGSDFADGLASIIPCFWIYAEVGQHLKKVGSANPVYQRWIDSYGGEDYQREVWLALELTDQVGEDLQPEPESRARGHFYAAARYEWMFWEAAYRMETWPL
jgi:thiaminase/transcriptional activator TenA